MSHQHPNQKNQPEKNSTSQPLRKGLSIVMTKSEPFEPRLPNSEATPTLSLPTLPTNMKSTAEPSTPTMSPVTPIGQVSQLKNMNPAGEQAATASPNPPTGTPAKSSPAKKDVAPKGTPPPKQISAAEKQLIRDLAGLYATIGMLVGSADTYTGVLLMQSANKRAEELVAVARHHKKMMEVLKQLTTSNDYITCIMGHGMMAYAILAHFGQVPQTPLIAAMGMSEAQVLAPPPGMEEMMNGHAPDLAYAGS